MRKLVFTLIMTLLSLPLVAQQLPERRAVRKGNRLYDKQQYEQSIERYQAALEAAPTQWEALYNRGNAEHRMERYEAAEKTLQVAAADSLQSAEHRAEAYYNLGNTQFKQQKLKEALQSYKQSLMLRPDDMECKYNYAYTKKLLEDQQQNGGGGQDNQDQIEDQNQPEQPEPNEGDEEDREGQPQQPQEGISEQEQAQILDAIQAQEDRTQEKLKEKQGVVVRGSKNW